MNIFASSAGILVACLRAKKRGQCNAGGADSQATSAPPGCAPSPNPFIQPTAEGQDWDEMQPRIQDQNLSASEGSYPSGCQALLLGQSWHGHPVCQGGP